jgi:hypothetical protein
MHWSQGRADGFHKSWGFTDDRLLILHSCDLDEELLFDSRHFASVISAHIAPLSTPFVHLFLLAFVA